jgi:hypothetical protein
MKRKISVPAILLFVFITAFAVDKGIAGKWTGLLTMPGGNTRTIHYVFKTDNNILTGTSQGNRNEYELSGKIYGDSLSFSVIVDNGESILNTGKYYPQGDSIVLDALFMGSTMHAILKRDSQ